MVAQQGFLAQIKAAIDSKPGSLFYVKSGEKRRIRFLADADEAIPVTMHSQWNEAESKADLQTPCFKHFGKPCPYCKNETINTALNYAFPVWDYEGNMVKLFMYKVSKKSVLVAVAEMAETYNTLLDRDYIISRSGAGFDTTYRVIGGDQSKFKAKVSVPDAGEILKMVLSSFAPKFMKTIFGDEDEEEADAIVEKNIGTTKQVAAKKSSKFFDDDEDDEEEETQEQPVKKVSKRQVQSEEEAPQKRQRKPAQFEVKRRKSPPPPVDDDDEEEDE